MNHFIGRVILLITLVTPAMSFAENLSAWKGIASFRPSTAIQQGVQARGDTQTVHRIEDASGRINLDYFPITISKLPIVSGQRLTAPELLKHIRLNLNSFVDTSVSTFEPFHNVDEQKWQSSSPSGALILINIKLTPVITDFALVVTSMESQNEWRFSTVRGGSGFTAVNDRDNPGAHPVSGNRAFGYYVSENEWKFYTIGADRATRSMDEFWGIPTAREIGFQQAEKLWKSFQTKVVDFVNAHEGQAKVDTVNSKSERFDWNQIQSNRDVYDISDQPTWHPVP